MFFDSRHSAVRGVEEEVGRLGVVHFRAARGFVDARQRLVQTGSGGRRSGSVNAGTTRKVGAGRTEKAESHARRTPRSGSDWRGHFSHRAIGDHQLDRLHLAGDLPESTPRYHSTSSRIAPDTICTSMSPRCSFRIPSALSHIAAARGSRCRPRPAPAQRRGRYSARCSVRSSLIMVPRSRRCW